jgi:uncharacterized protein YciI
MFLVTSRYTASPEEIARVLPAHREWLSLLYDRGIFILSGRLVPPTGGFMLARGIGRPELEALLADDPFRHAGLLVHSITELAPSRWSAELDTIMKGSS